MRKREVVETVPGLLYSLSIWYDICEGRHENSVFAKEIGGGAGDRAWALDTDLDATLFFCERKLNSKILTSAVTAPSPAEQRDNTDLTELGFNEKVFASILKHSGCKELLVSLWCWKRMGSVAGKEVGEDFFTKNWLGHATLSADKEKHSCE